MRGKPQVTVQTAASEALGELQRAYAQRPVAATRLAQSGHRVVGTTSSAVPEELVIAAGGVRVVVAPQPMTETPAADRYLEPRAPRDQRALFEQAVRGDFAMLDLLVLSREHELLYYYLKEMVRRGEGARIPPLWMFDLLPSQRAAVERYNRQQTRGLLERLERLARAPVSDDALRQAIANANVTRALLRRLQEQRWTGAVPGVEALQVIGAGFVLPLEQYTALLAAYLETLSAEPVPGRPRLLVVPSAPLSSTVLHGCLEQAGARVVAEDDPWGARAATEDVSEEGDPLEALMRHVWSNTLTHHQFPREPRQAWFREHAVSPGVEAVVFYVPPDDQQLGWDYPALKAWLDERGKPSLLVRADVEEPAGAAQAAEQAAGFVATLNRGDTAGAGAPR